MPFLSDRIQSINEIFYHAVQQARNEIEELYAQQTKVFTVFRK
jgi:hypothetical protein